MAMAGALTFSELAALMPQAGGRVRLPDGGVRRPRRLPVRLGLLPGVQRRWPRRAERRLRHLRRLLRARSARSGTKIVAIVGLLAAHDHQRRRRQGRRDLLGRLHGPEDSPASRRSSASVSCFGSSQHDRLLAVGGRRSRAASAARSPRRWSASSGPPAAGSTPPTRRREVKNPRRTLPLAMIIGTVGRHADLPARSTSPTCSC